MHSRIVQIAAGAGALYALDDKGWVYVHGSFGPNEGFSGWIPLYDDPYPPQKIKPSGERHDPQ